MSQRAPQHRNICFTVNADGEEPLLLLDPLHETWNHVKFCVYQREMGSHEHFQGYLELTTPKTYDALHNLEGLETAHFERRRGTAKQAEHYCMKPVDGCECNVCITERNSPTYIEGPWFHGERSQQGQRSELLEIQRDLDAGASMKRVAQTNFPEFVRFGKAFKDYKRLTAPKRDFKPYVWLFVGHAGTGKTRTATTLGKALGSFYRVPDKHTGFWCDDYDGEEVFFIDEMDGNRMTPNFFNALIDRYECVVPVHGGAGHQLISKHIIIASNYTPRVWWKNRNKEQQRQTMRRIDFVIPMFNKPVEKKKRPPTVLLKRFPPLEEMEDDLKIFKI